MYEQLKLLILITTRIYHNIFMSIFLACFKKNLVIPISVQYSRHFSNSDIERNYNISSNMFNYSY